MVTDLAHILKNRISGRIRLKFRGTFRRTQLSLKEAKGNARINKKLEILPKISKRFAQYGSKDSAFCLARGNS